jgi:hypothetical protein
MAALESLVDTKEFALARSFMPDPQKQIEQFAMPFNQSTRSVSPEIQEVQEALVRIYVKKVSKILQVFLGLGEEDVANHLRHYALECVADAQLRDRIMEQLLLFVKTWRSRRIRDLAPNSICGFR